MPLIDVFPLEPWAVVTSPFGKRWGRHHNGVDYGSPNPSQRTINGTPVRAPFAGTVTVGNEPGGAGQWSWVRADDGRALFKSFHHSRYEVRGGHVDAGDVIAYVGSTGASTGPHAHLELWVDGRPIDPQPHLEAARNRPVPAPAPPPVPDEETELMAAIDEIRAEFVNQDTRMQAFLAAFRQQLLDEIRAEFVNQDTRTRAYLDAKLA